MMDSTALNTTNSGSTCLIPGPTYDEPSRSSWLLYRIHNFSPAWFAGIMGCGISSTILYNFPFASHWLRVVGLIFYGFTMLLFSLFTVLFATRFILWPSQWTAVLRHPAQAAFLGCYPMAMATLISTTRFVFEDASKYPNTWLACYVLWWINLVISVASCWGVLFVMFKYQRRTELNQFNSVILLCVVPLVVCSSTGSLILSLIPESLQLMQLFLCFLLWANGEILAFVLISIYVYRLLRCNLPMTSMLLSNLLIVGPLGQGAFGILLMGVNANQILPTLVNLPTETTLTATTAVVLVYLTGFLALFLLSFAFFWMAITLFSGIMARKPGYTEIDCEKANNFMSPESSSLESIHNLPGIFSKFTPAWWGMTFPIGTVSTACSQLGKELSLLTFRVLGAIFGVFVVLAVFVCLFGWIKFGLLSDDLFEAAQRETGLKSNNQDQITKVK